MLRANYRLYQYPTFPVCKAGVPVAVKPNTTASIWEVTGPDVRCFLGAEQADSKTHWQLLNELSPKSSMMETFHGTLCTVRSTRGRVAFLHLQKK